MFYCHEILTNRRYGVATVWLVATLGSKSVLRKVSRKAIIGVNVPKACETIMQPEAPMALRLQSNLLYGVSRVYSQQCGYILADTQDALNALKTLLRAVQTSELDPLAGKARPEQLILMDDPALALDMAFPSPELNFSNPNMDDSFLRDTQYSALSPYTQSQGYSSTSGGRSALDLQIPSSDVGGIEYRLPYNDPFQLGDSSIHKLVDIGRAHGNEEVAMIEDFDFEFDADGTIRDIGAAERDLFRTESVLPRLSRLGSDSAASGRVRLDHEEGLLGLTKDRLDTEGYQIMQMDDEYVLPDTEAFPLPGVAEQGQRGRDASTVVQTESSSISAEAPLKTRKRKVAKPITNDQYTAFNSSVLRKWNEQYLQNMEAARRVQQAHRAPALAKKNAYAWVFGNGIGGVGAGVGSSKIPSPLDMFSGANLMIAITGKSSANRLVKPSKRPRPDEDEDEDEVRRVRARSGLEDDQIGRRGDDDGFVPIFDESMEIEAGRDAKLALEDHATSAMPWNISSSLLSYRNLPGPGSSSVPGHATILGRQSSILSAGRMRRVTSASPLVGRGTVTDDYSLGFDDAIEFPLAADELENFQDALEKQRGDFVPLTDTQAQEFEIFGPAAGVDTQMAQSSWWIKDALARESLNFFEYVKNTLFEQEGREVNDRDLDLDADVLQLLEGEDISNFPPRSGQKTVGFETLFTPESNSKMVAAQAFHHVLTLATKNLLGVQQLEPYDEIWMHVK